MKTKGANRRGYYDLRCSLHLRVTMMMMKKMKKKKTTSRSNRVAKVGESDSLCSTMEL